MLIWYEIQDQSRYHHGNRSVIERNRRRATLVKRHLACKILLRGLEKSIGRLDPRDRGTARPG